MHSLWLRLMLAYWLKSYTALRLAETAVSLLVKLCP
jgi:hypothetical protein